MKQCVVSRSEKEGSAREAGEQDDALLLYACKEEGKGKARDL